MADGEFALILEEYEPIPPEALVPVLKSRLGMLHFDAMRLAKGSRGIVMERLSRPSADALRSGLADAGFATRIIPQDGVIAVNQPQTARTIELRDDMLDVLWGYTGGSQPIPWENVFLISAGEITKLEGGVTRRPKKKRRPGMLSGALFLAAPGLAVVAGATQSLAEPTGPAPKSGQNKVAVHLADIFAIDAERAFRHIRLGSRQLCFEQILGADDRHDPLLNFRLVLRRILEKAHKAQVSKPTLACLAEPASTVADQANGTTKNEQQQKSTQANLQERFERILQFAVCGFRFFSQSIFHVTEPPSLDTKAWVFQR